MWVRVDSANRMLESLTFICFQSGIMEDLAHTHTDKQPLRPPPPPTHTYTIPETYQ